MNILVTGARAPIAADIAKAFAVSGHKVWLTDSLRYPVSAGSPYIEGLIRLPPPRTCYKEFSIGLAACCRGLAIDAIIPTSEEIFWLACAAANLPATVNLRTSPFNVLARLHNKATFAKLAGELGYGAQENYEINSPADLAQIVDPRRFVFKPIYSRFATHTLIGPTEAALKRLRPTSKSPWLAQTLVQGREVCVYNIAERGRLLMHTAYEPGIRFGKGASIYFVPLVDERLRALSEAFIAATDFTGQISFDIIVTDEKLVALECNPRGTSGVHLAAQDPQAFSSALIGWRQSEASSNRSQARMLFLPWLLNSPGMLFRSQDRALRRVAKDAFASAEVGVFAQVKALSELAWRALCSRSTLAAASTADIEWNGETINA